jgi:hypothetical protein
MQLTFLFFCSTLLVLCLLRDLLWLSTSSNLLCLVCATPLPCLALSLCFLLALPYMCFVSFVTFLGCLLLQTYFVSFVLCPLRALPCSFVSKLYIVNIVFFFFSFAYCMPCRTQLSRQHSMPSLTLLKESLGSCQQNQPRRPKQSVRYTQQIPNVDF